MASEFKNRLKRLQGGRASRDGSRHSDAKWRAKLGQSFQTLRAVCCPHVQEFKASGKNARRVILEESLAHIKQTENRIVETFGSDTLEYYRHCFQQLEARYSEPVAPVSASFPSKCKKPRMINMNEISFSQSGFVSPCPSTVVKSEDDSQFSEPESVSNEIALLTNLPTSFGCTQAELDQLKQFIEKTPDKADLMDVISSERIKWSCIKGRTNCRRKLDMESVADYLDSSEELKKEVSSQEAENVAKLSVLSGDDVLEYFENSNEGPSQYSQSSAVCEFSSPPKNSQSFEFDENLVRDFLKSEGQITNYTPSQE